MDNLEAVPIAEGTDTSADEATTLEAWQHLVNTGLAWQLPWQLQGTFGRQATALIEVGLIQPADSNEPELTAPHFTPWDYEVKAATARREALNGHGFSRNEGW